MKKIIIASVLAFASLGSAHAENIDYRPLNFVAGVGFTYGGDRLASGSQQYNDLRAGKGLLFALGADYRFSQRFSMQGTVGYHIDAVSSSYSGNVTFTRVPVELMAYYNVHKRWRLGAGARRAGSASSDVRYYYYTAGEMKSSVAPVVEGEFLLNDHVGFKLRYVSEKFTRTEGYDPRHTYEHTVKANHVGIMTNFYF